VSGKDALAKLPAVRPDAVLLDLSMPEMDGEEVLAAMQGDPDLRDVPVIVVSSEVQRGEACLTRGAAAFLAKPIRADELLARVTRTIEDAAFSRRRRGLPCVSLSVGPLELAVPLTAVDAVLPQVQTRSLPGGPPYACELVDYYGEPVLVLDAAARFGVEHEAPLLERMLVIVAEGRQRLALCVDHVSDPEEVPPEDLLARDSLGGAALGNLGELLVAVVRGERGPVPVIAPAALLTPDELEQVARLLRPESPSP
jgi:CheY-like chemotaxis protein